LLLGTYFEGENPLQSEIIKVSGLAKNTVSKAMRGLKEKGFI
jgi:DNA-binding MarR family transcriptional regulator